MCINLETKLIKYCDDNLHNEMKQITIKEKLSWIRDQKPRDGLLTDVLISDKEYKGNLEVTSGKTNLSVSIKLEKFRGVD